MKEETNTILDQAEQYIKTSMELYTLTLTGKIAKAVSTLVTQLVIGILSMIVLFLLVMCLAFWIGDLLGHDYLGFLIMGGVLGLVTFILFVKRHNLIRKPVMNNIISDILK
jgi:pheromone shutdown protein TraB